MRGSRTRSETRGQGFQDPPRNFQSMPFDEVLPPLLEEDLKDHIGGFNPFNPEVMRAQLPSKMVVATHENL